MAGFFILIVVMLELIVALTYLKISDLNSCLKFSVSVGLLVGSCFSRNFLGMVLFFWIFLW